MLDEKVRGPAGSYIYAYLVELRTIAGLSGSPVFVNNPPTEVRDGRMFVMSNNGVTGFSPLGMLLGYHVVESREDIIAADSGNLEKALSSDERNTGFGIVVPFERILEILESDDAIRLMDCAIDKFEKASPFREA